MGQERNGRTDWKPAVVSMVIYFPRRQKIFFNICKNARVFRVLFVSGEIFPQYALA
jgi:hypothetical protein